MSQKGEAAIIGWSVDLDKYFSGFENMSFGLKQEGLNMNGGSECFIRKVIWPVSEDLDS